MSKTYLDQVEKVKMLVEGLRSHYDMVKDYGISLEQLDKMEQLSAEAEKKNAEVDRLRLETSEKLREANMLLSELKEIWLPVKTQVKASFDQPQWETFGIQDKR